MATSADTPTHLIPRHPWPMAFPWMARRSACSSSWAFCALFLSHCHVRLQSKLPDRDRRAVLRILKIIFTSLVHISHRSIYFGVAINQSFPAPLKWVGLKVCIFILAWSDDGDGDGDGDDDDDDILTICWGHIEDILMIYWWYILMIYWWYIDDILMIYWWYIDDILMRYWWDIDEILMRYVDDILMIYWWYVDDILMICWWYIGHVLMMYILMMYWLFIIDYILVIYWW